MIPIFDWKVSKPRISYELDRMLSDRKIGLHSIELMTDLGILDNYVAEICNPFPERKIKQVPEACLLKDTFKQDALILARLLEENIGETDDPNLFKNIYYLCIFKVFESEPDILYEKMNQMQVSKKTKKFVMDNIQKYPYILNHEIDKASKQMAKNL
jgi:hypothetical protein